MAIVGAHAFTWTILAVFGTSTGRYDNGCGAGAKMVAMETAGSTLGVPSPVGAAFGGRVPVLFDDDDDGDDKDDGGPVGPGVPAVTVTVTVIASFSSTMIALPGSFEGSTYSGYIWLYWAVRAWGEVGTWLMLCQIAWLVSAISAVRFRLVASNEGPRGSGVVML